MGVLAPSLRGDGGRRPLDDFQQGLLDALAGDVARDGRVLGLAADLVDLVDVDDPALGSLHVVLGGLEELEDDVLDVLPHVPRLGQRRGVGDRERNVQHPGERLGEERLPRPRRTDQENVRLLKLDAVPVGRRGDPLVVVVHRDREALLGPILADHVVVQDFPDLGRAGDASAPFGRGRGVVLGEDVVAEVDAFVADVDGGTGDELLHLVLALPAERAPEPASLLTAFRHPPPPLPISDFRFPISNFQFTIYNQSSRLNPSSAFPS